MLIKVAWNSLLNRKSTVLLTVLSVTVGVFTLLGVEHIRQQAKTSFTSSVSGTDLIVGARTSPSNLLLYSIFRIGNATNNIGWQSYQHFADHPQVAWTIPISLGDSHRGHRVMGTNDDFFKHFRYGAKQPLTFAEGDGFNHTFAVVLGAEVAKQLNYPLGHEVVLAHGLGSTSFTMHSDAPFTVTGILAPTGTPVDRTVHVPLAGITALHGGGAHSAEQQPHDHDHAHEHEHEHESETHGESQHEPGGDQEADITAFLVGLNSKASTFSVQRQINDYPQEPLTAILPGVAMTELWQIMGSIERVMQLISSLVFVAAMLGLCAMLMASMRERRREMAVLRAIGAGPGFVFLLLQAEAVLMVATGAAIALALLQLGLPLAQSALVQHFGLMIEGSVVNASSLKMLLGVLAAALVVALIPALSAYKQSLHGGLMQRG